MISRFALLLLCVPLGMSCNATGNATNTTEPGKQPVTQPEPIQNYGYEVVKTYPHDVKSYTQGLIWIPGGAFYESAGQYGQSELRKVNLADGKPTMRQKIDAKYFAEGLALFNGKLFQLTWQEFKGFIYEAASFKKVGEWDYDSEGWGLTNDDKSLIMSDGSNRIRFLDPKTQKIERFIDVFSDNDPAMPQFNLNELEYVKGEIWANVYTTDLILRIDPKNGKILGRIDMSNLLGQRLSDPGYVLNGIAYDAKDDRIFVTGKCWPKLFEIKVVKK